MTSLLHWFCLLLLPPLLLLLLTLTLVLQYQPIRTWRLLLVQLHVSHGARQLFAL